jgi:tetratricopeptide (TPR) repeat protein
MSSQPPAPTFESRDVVLFEFKQEDLEVDTSPGEGNDEFIRHYVSMYFATDLRSGRDPADLERLLALAREREQFCRGANDLFGLARCLGNQALIQKARERNEEALSLVKQLELLCRRIDDLEGLTFALAQQAVLLAHHLGKPAEALPLAEQAQRLAADNHLSKLADYIAPILQDLHNRKLPPGQSS